jgi:hypothetical protein
MPSNHEVLKEHGFALAGVNVWLHPSGYQLLSTEAALQMIREDPTRRMSAVSEWELRLPIGDPDQPLDADALSDLPSALPPGEQRELARDFLFQAG